MSRYFLSLAAPLSHRLRLTPVTDTPGWIITLLPSTLSFSHQSSHPVPSLALRRWLSAASSHCLRGSGGCHIAFWYLSVHLSWAVSPLSRRLVSRECQAWVDGPRKGGVMTSWFALTDTELHTDWRYVRRAADISCNLCVTMCGAAADGFHILGGYHRVHDGMWLHTSSCVIQLNSVDTRMYKYCTMIVQLMQKQEGFLKV